MSKLRTLKVLLAAAIAFGAMPALPEARAQTVLKVMPEILPRILDPHFSTAFATRDFGYLVYDTLFATDQYFMPKPQMVDTYTLSADRLTYTFVLRPGLKWHDGQPVTAADCVASLRRWAVNDPMGQTLMAHTATLEADDARTFKLVLKEPYELVLDSLAKIGAPVPFMMPERLASKPATEQLTEIVGSGPYRFRPDLYEPGSKIIVDKFADYVPRQEPPSWASGGKVAKIDRIELTSLNDSLTQVNALSKGEVDYLERVPGDLVSLLGPNTNAKAEIISPPGMQAVMRFNHLQPPFNDVTVRQAVARAIDRQMYADAVADVPTYGSACAAIFGCGTPFESDDGIPARNLSEAKAMLRLANVDFSKPIIMLHTPDAPPVYALGNVTRQVLTDLGFKVEVHAMDFQTFVMRRLNDKPVNQGGWNVAHTAFAVTDQFNPMSNGFLIATGRNGAQWGWPSDPELEALKLKFAAASDASERRMIAIEMQRRAYDRVLYLPLAQFTIPTGWRTNLSGVLKAPVMLLYNIEKK